MGAIKGAEWATGFGAYEDTAASVFHTYTVE